MDGIRLYRVSRKKLDQLLEIAEIYSSDIRMSFGLDKCRIMDPSNKRDSEKVIDRDRMGQEIQEMEPGETYRYVEVEQHRRTEHQIMKEETRVKFVDRMKQILKTGLNSKNIVKAVNTYVIPIMTYSFGVVRWAKTELDDMERQAN